MSRAGERSAASDTGSVLLEAEPPRARLEDLAVTFHTGKTPLRALRGIDLEVGAGEILAIVGESGSGKSVMGLAMLGLLGGRSAPEISGRAKICGVDMVSATPEERRVIRRDRLGAVFQDPMTSLNPTMRIGRQVAEAAGSTEEARRLLDLVGVPDAARRMRSFPHELSGGLRQRVMIAMAVAGGPELVIADEPTTALDVTVQAQVLGLLGDLRDELGTSFILVTHDIGVASQIADRILVMYAGRAAEVGNTADVLRGASHPYTVALLDSRLSLEHPRDRRLRALPGEPPDPHRHPPGCAFAPRCPAAVSACTDGLPALTPAWSHGGEAACIVPRATADRGILAETDGFPATAPTARSAPALRLRGVEKDFRLRQGFRKHETLRALRQIELEVGPTESVAVVGESGSGKSTLLRVVANLQRADGGEVDCTDGGVQMVFQDAGASLTPWMTVGEVIGERLLRTTNRAERRRRVAAALAQVGLPGTVADRKTAALSGGQRQRVAFARAVIEPPRLLLCDEPTSALDVSLAASVLNLLQDLRREMGMAVLFVTHDLAAARFISDRIVVMYLGEVVEVAPTEQLIADPKHPYTKALLAAVPDPGHPPLRLRGEPASPLDIPSGCPFNPRCTERLERCGVEVPRLDPTDASGSRRAACLLVGATGEEEGDRG